MCCYTRWTRPCWGSWASPALLARPRLGEPHTVRSTGRAARCPCLAPRVREFDCAVCLACPHQRTPLLVGRQGCFVVIERPSGVATTATTPSTATTPRAWRRLQRWGARLRRGAGTYRALGLRGILTHCPRSPRAAAGCDDCDGTKCFDLGGQAILPPPSSLALLPPGGLGLAPAPSSQQAGSPLPSFLSSSPPDRYPRRFLSSP